MHLPSIGKVARERKLGLYVRISPTAWEVGCCIK